MTRLGGWRPGRPWPLGVTPEGDGANVAVVSRHAERIELCLFDRAGAIETHRLSLPERSDDVHHGFLPGLVAGAVYGLRAYGAWDPGRGDRFNPAKLLLDPYARALTGQFQWAGPNLVDATAPFTLNPRDSAALVPKAVVTPPLPSPGLPPSSTASPGPRPGTPWDRTVLYELHVKGLTRLHPAVPEGQRGTYAGLAHPAVLEHLLKLGVTTVELLPVAAFLDEARLVQRGLVNYWGYNPYALMAVEPRYASPPAAATPAGPAAELMAAIAALHAAGLEVIVDVVLNHTAESDEFGPTLSFRGLDNRLYYRLRGGDPGLYVDHAGCGNTLDFSEPRVVQLALDSLRHWASLGVDGFRFDLGSVLGRDRGDRFDPAAPFFQALAQDPWLGGLKLIAEPWDIGPHGYQAGRFPPPLAEWNDRFRDTTRRFWRGDPGMLPALASCLLGSAERFERGGRRAWASVNFVTAHDGATLADLITYRHKRNQANGEDNRDGHADEHWLDHGVDGPSIEPAIRAARARTRRNLLATLLLAQGTPMLSMGDEAGRSQHGNTNAYCQDNGTSWYNWPGIMADEHAMIGFVRRLVRLRAAHPVLRRRRFLHGRQVDADGVPDVAWLTPAGVAPDAAFWHDPEQRCVGLLLGGAAGPELAEDGGPGSDATLLLLLNADVVPVTFDLPAVGRIAGWHIIQDTNEPEPAGEPEPAAGQGAARSVPAGSGMILPGDSLRLLAGRLDDG